MCKLAALNDESNNILVAEIKKEYINNIIEQAKKCKNITRIILFGSSLEERCSAKSDIDIAVFGKMTRGKYLKSAEFRNFNIEIFAYKDFDGQNYDILYFKDDCDTDSKIMKNILAGTEIYRGAA